MSLISILDFIKAYAEISPKKAHGGVDYTYTATFIIRTYKTFCNYASVLTHQCSQKTSYFPPHFVLDKAHTSLCVKLQPMLAERPTLTVFTPFARHQSSDYVTDHVASINPFFFTYVR